MLGHIHRTDQSTTAISAKHTARNMLQETLQVQGIGRKEASKKRDRKAYTSLLTYKGFDQQPKQTQQKALTS